MNRAETRAFTADRPPLPPDGSGGVRRPSGLRLPKMGRFLVERALRRADVRIDGDRPHDIRVLDPRFYGDVLRRGSLGFGECYVRRWWDADDVEELAFRLIRSGVYSLSSAVPGLPRDLRDMFANQQTRRLATRVADEHYSMGNDVFFAFLGGVRNYSCGIFDGDADLDAAQTRKLAKISSLLDLRPGERLLDVGGGWGELSRHAAAAHGCEVTHVNLSDEQIRHASALCTDLSVRVEKRDWRDVEGRFDKIAVIAMLTHVGPKNYRRFMQRMHDRLEPGGLMLIETVGTRHAAVRCEAWLDKYIFPGGVVPTRRQILGAADGLFDETRFESSGEHYVQTLRCWQENFERNWTDLSSRYDEERRRIFNYFFQSIGGAFRAGYVDHWHILLRRTG